jgi:hypothetical protein
MQCLLGVREIPTPEEIEAFVKAAVSRFLDGSRGNRARRAEGIRL